MSPVSPMIRYSRGLYTLSRKSRCITKSSLLCIPHNRSFSQTPIVLNDLPYHLVVGLPALSPTMEAGTLAEWYVAEGDSFSAGDGIARIETDKAAMDFEAQDDGYVAKILMQVEQGNEGTCTVLRITQSLKYKLMFFIS
jgi:Biotin-requiring enzyme